MKTLYSLILTIAALTIAYAASAQSLQAGTYVEKTHISPKLGTAIGYTFNSQIELGGFYQTATEQLPTREDGYQIHEQEFYGMYFSYPVLGGEKSNIKFNVRTGVTNNQNFAITPSILANHNILKTVALGAGVGIRAFRPTLQASIKLNI